MRFRSTIVPLTIAMLLSAGCSATHTSQTDSLVPAAAPQNASSSARDVDRTVLESGLPSDPTKSRVSTDSSRAPQIFLGAFVPGRILVYNATSLAKVRAISNNLQYPEGIAVDTKGTLYVAVYGYQSVEIFKRGAKSPSQVIAACTAPGDGPVDVAVTSTFGFLVACILGDTLEFTAGATKSNGKLTFPGLGNVNGVHIDGEGNVYAVGGTADNCVCPLFVEYVGGKEPGKVLNLLGTSGPLTLLVDKKGNLLVSDVAGYVFLYHPGGHSPYKTLVVNAADRIAFNSTKTLLYVTQGYLGAFSVYQYPSLKLVRTVTVSQHPKKAPALFGIAVWPPTD